MLPNLKDYNETVNYLYNLRSLGIKLGLSNTKKVMGILGEPQNSFRSVHIAGTNGKGSTASTIASILTESGFRVGLYTSPHLLNFTERIKINNNQITEDKVLSLTSHIQDIIAGTDLQLTFFEFATAIAFYYFASEKVDWAVVETGMGGRLDATNVILPDVSVITSIGLDHSEFLGSSISAIAFEKAGIIKPETPVVTSAQRPEAIKQITDIAKMRNSELHIYDRDFKSALLSMDDKHITFDYAGDKEFRNLSLPLSGGHQLYNASLAIRVSEILCKKGVPILDTSLRNGLLNVALQGRLERVSENPVIIIDGAHNPGAADSLAGSIKKIFPDKKIIMVIGIMSDKDIEGILKPLMQIAEHVVLTKPKGERAASPEKLYETALKIQKSNEDGRSSSIVKTNCVADALTHAKKEWREENIILVTGSFYTTGEAKEILSHAGVLSDLRE
ncbi:MAG: bifunctional folylpolyglutamate synthase/dihydrofolate synthase [Nitrospirae bacterium]|nr:bifunctional folylpolyglutamate synthase/dihydrofolate synthase [Nitrospirota bacterium]